MRFLADENVSNKVVNALRNKGTDIVSSKDFGSSLSDEIVLETANAKTESLSLLMLILLNLFSKENLRPRVLSF
jgi:hypothetical protein